jgi:hypothetical protein
MGFQVSYGLLELIYRFIFVNAGTLRNFTTALTGRDSSVGIATRYELYGLEIESRSGGEIFRTRPDRLSGPLSLLYNGHRVIPGGKAAGAWR